MDVADTAKELPLEASRDPSGLILKLTSMGGSVYFKSNGRAFGDGIPGDQSPVGWWDQATFGFGLIEPQGAGAKSTASLPRDTRRLTVCGIASSHNRGGAAVMKVLVVDDNPEVIDILGNDTTKTIQVAVKGVHAARA